MCPYYRGQYNKIKPYTIRNLAYTTGVLVRDVHALGVLLHSRELSRLLYHHLGCQNYGAGVFLLVFLKPNQVLLKY